MKYQLTDYQGSVLSLTPDQAAKIAAVANLIEVTVDGQVHYLNPKDIASIKPIGMSSDQEHKLFPHRYAAEISKG